MGTPGSVGIGNAREALSPPAAPGVRRPLPAPRAAAVLSPEPAPAGTAPCGSGHGVGIAWIQPGSRQRGGYESQPYELPEEIGNCCTSESPSTPSGTSLPGHVWIFQLMFPIFYVLLYFLFPVLFYVFSVLFSIFSVFLTVFFTLPVLFSLFSVLSTFPMPLFLSSVCSIFSMSFPQLFPTSPILPMGFSRRFPTLLPPPSPQSHSVPFLGHLELDPAGAQEPPQPPVPPEQPQPKPRPEFWGGGKRVNDNPSGTFQPQ